MTSGKSLQFSGPQVPLVVKHGGGINHPDFFYGSACLITVEPLISGSSSLSTHPSKGRMRQTGAILIEGREIASPEAPPQIKTSPSIVRRTLG
jgi:hypothetical protein